MGGDNGALTVDEILKLEDRPIERVDFPDNIPGWGGRHVYIRTIGGKDRDNFDLSFVDLETGKVRGGEKNVRARLVACCACSRDGIRMFSDKQVEALGTKNGAALDLIYERARKLNRMGEKDIQELVGNLSGDPSGDSGSLSQPVKAGRSPKHSRK